MDATPPNSGARRSAGSRKLSCRAVIGLAITFGLCAGYLDVTLIVLRKVLAKAPSAFKNAADFPWTVPAGHAALLLVPGVLLGVLTALHPRGLSLRSASWLLATLAIWGALLRLPLYGIATLILAAGLATHVSAATAALCARQAGAGGLWRGRRPHAGPGGQLVGLARALRESVARAIASTAVPFP